MPLVEIGVAALTVGVAVVLGVQERGEVCGWTSLHGTGTPGPVGNPPAVARLSSVAKPPGRSAANDGFGPDGRKKLNTAGAPMDPTGAPVQLQEPKPSPRIAGATMKMLPEAVAMQEFCAAAGTGTKRGLVPAGTRPIAMAWASLLTSRPGSVTFLLIVRSRWTPWV